jgi:hypothetical protein
VQPLLLILGLILVYIGFFGAVFSARVLLDLLRRGPGAAEDALARTAPPSNWSG